VPQPATAARQRCFVQPRETEDGARCWSEWQDLNLRPPRPERGALPGCATLRPYAGSRFITMAPSSGNTPLAGDRRLRRLGPIARYGRRSPEAERRLSNRMGRSQAVRQRVLIPSFPGSNPGAPAIFPSAPQPTNSRITVASGGTVTSIDCLRPWEAIGSAFMAPPFRMSLPPYCLASVLTASR
jgi:hypothetical protein